MFKNLFNKKQKTYDDVLVDGIDTDGRPKDDDIPWIKLEGKPTEDGQIRLEADWTPGLITFLREKYGYTGNDDSVAHRFIAQMHAQLMDNSGEDSDYI
jgi:hypothetical protein